MKFIVIFNGCGQIFTHRVIILNMYIIGIRTITMICLEARKWQMKGYHE